MTERAKHFFGIDPASQWDCGFSCDCGESRCTADGTFHGLALNAKPGVPITNLVACDDHRADMVVLVDFVHPMDSACGVGKPWWRWATGESGCTVDWSDAPALLAAAEPVGAAL